jgi:transposase
MAITPECEAKILRYYHVEKWRVGSISRQLGVHHTTIKRVLAQTGIPKPELLPQPSMIDPFLPFILQTLEKYPTLTASRLYHMVVERGYSGGPDHFRHLIALYRPKHAAEAYLRLRTLPGEQAQVDWGHFGYIIIGKAKRPLMAFVMVLSFSRKIFLRFYLNQRMENFLRGHETAFTYFSGVPKVCLYDNLKSAVLERLGDAIRFHPTLLDFSAHYRFEPRPVAVARGNEKGRVERAIRYVRDNFFAGRQWKDIDDLNVQATTWCDGIASNRPCPEDKSQSVQTIFLQEQPQLIALPDNLYPTAEKESVKVGKTPYIRFDLNDYSVPHTLVREKLNVSATLDKITILKGIDIVAEHVRCFDKAKTIENPAHIKALADIKKNARHHRGQHRLTHAIPCAEKLLKQAALRGYHLASITSQLLQLLDDYGAVACEAAIQEALLRDVPHPNAVRLSLEKHRTERHLEPPVRLDLPKDKKIRELTVRPHDLNTYDQLQKTLEEDNDDNQQ